jgi:hypothetical protein
VNATTELRAWQRASTGRKVHWGITLVAMADGERSLFATGADTEASARACLALWYSEEMEAA